MPPSAATLFSKPLAIVPINGVGLSPTDEALWFARFRSARRQVTIAKDARTRKRWTKRVHHCRSFIAASNTGLVNKIISKYLLTSPSNLQYRDSIDSAAHFGMHKAVEGFDCKRKVKFSTYAWTVMSKEVTRTLSREGRNRARFISESNYYVNPDLAGMAGVEDRERITIGTPENLYSLAEAMEIAPLTNIERTVLDLRYRQGLTLDDAGIVIKRTKERVRQVQNKALEKLRAILTESSNHD